MASIPEDLWALCSGKETGNHCSLNASPMCASSETPEGGRRSGPHCDSHTQRWQEAVLPRTESASPEDEPCGFPSFCLYLISYTSPPHTDSSQPPIPTAGRAQASTDQSSQLRNGPLKTEGVSLQNNSFSHLKSCSPYSPGSGEKVNMDIFLSSDLSCLSLTTSTTTPAKTQKQTVAINFKTQEPRTHLTKR